MPKKAPAAAEPVRKVSVNLPAALVDAIDAAAAADRRDRSGLMRVLLERALADARRAG